MSSGATLKRGFMSFFGALFGGQNGTLSKDISKTGQIGDFSNSLGTSNTTKGSDFFSSLLSGDSSKVATTLAPQISAEKTSLQQNQKTSAQNGDRSGGKAASNDAAQDKVHSDITNLTGSLTSGAASTLLSSGQSLLGAATGAYDQQSKLSQQQMENWEKSILGTGITGAINYGESFLPIPHGGK